MAGRPNRAQAAVGQTDTVPNRSWAERCSGSAANGLAPESLHSVLSLSDLGASCLRWLCSAPQNGSGNWNSRRRSRPRFQRGGLPVSTGEPPCPSRGGSVERRQAAGTPRRRSGEGPAHAAAWEIKERPGVTWARCVDAGIFRAYDIRGVIGEPRRRNARQVGRVLGICAGENRTRRRGARWPAVRSGFAGMVQELPRPGAMFLDIGAVPTGVLLRRHQLA
jgi:hypothetical protein